MTERAFHPYYVEQLPYVVASIIPEEAPEVRFITEVIDCDPDAVAIGDEVEIVYTDVRDAITLPLCRRQADHSDPSEQSAATL